MFFWEASEEVEEERSKGMIHNGVPKLTKPFMRRLRIDNFMGMLSSQIAAWCIIVVAATVLHQNGITHITSAAQAAKALEPLVHTLSACGVSGGIDLCHRDYRTGFSGRAGFFRVGILCAVRGV